MIHHIEGTQLWNLHPLMWCGSLFDVHVKLLNRIIGCSITNWSMEGLSHGNTKSWLEFNSTLSVWYSRFWVIKYRITLLAIIFWKSLHASLLQMHGARNREVQRISFREPEWVLGWENTNWCNTNLLFFFFFSLFLLSLPFLFLALALVFILFWLIFCFVFIFTLV